MRVLQEGTRLAERYTLIRRLGAGGMADVWLAQDSRGDDHVALKIAKNNELDPVRVNQLLQKEWRVASRMMHANIVRVFEFHDESDGAFFGMQYVGEVDLSVVTGKVLADGLRPLGLIADALRYAHAKDVVHRDIKASNILLDKRGAPYLIDFGVATAEGVQTQGGSEIAMSPQQLVGEPASAADDIYALGVLTHEVMTGVPPVVAESAQIIVTLADGSLMPRPMQSLLADMLASEPGARPDAETVVERLAEAGHPAGAVPLHYLGGAPHTEQVIEAVETVQPIRRAQPKAAAAESASRRDGIPPKILYGGLGIAALLLVLVVFVLPAVVDDSDVAQTVEQTVAEPTENLPVEDEATEQDPADVAAVKLATDEALGDLLSQMERLRYRGIERWGGQPYLDAVDIYRTGDEAYVNKNYQLAGDRYRQTSTMLEPFFDQINDVFERTLTEAKAAFERSDPSEAVRLYDLAVAITPGNREASDGLARALNLEAVLTLTSQGRQFEANLELDAAKTAFEQALQLDAVWQPALDGIERVRVAIRQLSFEQRMTEGLEALALGDFESARAAFTAASNLDPNSNQPADGLLQVENGIKLRDIQNLEQQAMSLIAEEQWETSIGIYEQILKIDGDLQFAREGLAEARNRSALHAKLQALIDQPDNLSDEANIRSATTLFLDVSRIAPLGPRLEEQKDELQRLLKRAATPLTVQFVSDNQTDVSVFKVGNLGTFGTRELELRPGQYVAVGYRPGYRDVRIEFRVAPEITMQPVTVQCEEQI